MQIGRTDLEIAVDQGVLSQEQADKLLALAAKRQTDWPRLTFEHLTYFLGGLVVIAAMGWFLTEAWNGMGGVGFLLAAVCYAGSFLWAGLIMWDRPGGRVPGGVLVTVAVCMTPPGRLRSGADDWLLAARPPGLLSPILHTD